MPSQTRATGPLTPQLAAVVSVDIAGFDEMASFEQAQRRRGLVAALRRALDGLDPSMWWQVDWQHSVLLVFSASPEHAMYLVQSLLPDAVQGAWRMGVHLGMVAAAADLEGRPQAVGEGVARVRSLSGQALPGQALASRAYVDAVRDWHPGYQGLFRARPSEAPADPLLAPWEVVPVAGWVDEAARRWAAEWSDPPQRPVRPGGPAVGTRTDTRSGTEPREAAGWQHARQLIATWFVPFNALLFSIGLLLSQGHRVGLTEARLLVLGLIVAAIGGVALLRLTLRRRRSGLPRPGGSATVGAAWVAMIYGTLLTIGALMAQMWVLDRGVPAPALAAPVPATAPVQHSVSVPVPVPVPVTAAPSEPGRALDPPAAVAAPVQGPAAPTVSRPAPSVPAEATPAEASSPRPQVATQAPKPAQASPTPPVALRRPEPGPALSPAQQARCSAIVARSALGEPLSPQEKRELISECR